MLSYELDIHVIYARFSGPDVRAETWTVKKVEELDVAETRVLTWMCGVTKLNRKRNESRIKKDIWVKSDGDGCVEEGKEVGSGGGWTASGMA